MPMRPFQLQFTLFARFPQAGMHRPLTPTVCGIPQQRNAIICQRCSLAMSFVCLLEIDLDLSQRIPVISFFTDMLL